MERRDFIRNSIGGLAALGAAGMVLRSDALPTPRSLDADDAEKLFGELTGPQPSPAPAVELKPTTARELGPFYRTGAPYRAKLTPPLEPGIVLVVTGRVWSFGSKRPLPNAMLDLWQVDNQTRDYSNGGGDFKNRTRLLTDEKGAYEFETVHPVPYQPSPNFWRSPHVHFIATAAGHKRLVSELFFKGDEKQDIDQLFHSSLAMPVQSRAVNGQRVETVVFDIVLEADK
jgi:catechol 1,2-dioxygenase